jgi:hypothetical protein
MSENNPTTTAAAAAAPTTGLYVYLNHALQPVL